MRESGIQTDIMCALGGHQKVVWCMVVTTGIFRVKGGYITTGHYMTEHEKQNTGMSDVIGQLIDGRFFSIEVKKPKKEPTEEQYAFLDLVRNNNGVSGWCDSVEGALKIID